MKNVLLVVVIMLGEFVSEAQEEAPKYYFGDVALRAVPEKEAVPPIEPSQWTTEAKIWVARSCAGEAGFFALEECSGIAWVYATRAREHGQSFVNVVKGYSAAVRKDNRPGREWILGLRLNSKHPSGWPESLSWKRHRVWWERMLSMLDLWSKGYIANPVDSANHFGGRMDVPGIHWKRIEPVSYMTFRNRFYRS